MSVPFTKIAYDDFYKFIVSAGTLIFLASIVGFLNSNDPFKTIFGIIAISCTIGVVFGLFKWHTNQRELDQKLKLSKENDILQNELLKLNITKEKNSQLKLYTRTEVKPETVEKIEKVEGKYEQH